MSTTGLTAQAFGAGDKSALARALMQPLGIALVAGLAFVTLKSPLKHLALSLVGGDPDDAVPGIAVYACPLAQRACHAGKPCAARVAAWRSHRLISY